MSIRRARPCRRQREAILHGDFLVIAVVNDERGRGQLSGDASQVEPAQRLADSACDQLKKTGKFLLGDPVSSSPTFDDRGE